MGVTDYMEQLELQAANRDVLGKKVRFLRRQGITPVHLLGHGIKSEALQCDTAQLQRTLAQAGKTRLISLKIGKAKKPRDVMVREVQREPRTGGLLHVDFYQVKMAEKVRLGVPIVLVGEAPALRMRENMLGQELNNLNIECLPGDVPTSIELDVSSLAEAGQTIRVKDIALGEDIAVLDDAELLVVKISTRRITEEIAEGVAEAPEAPGEASPSEEGAKKE